PAAGTGAVDAGPVEQVDPAVDRRELAAHVGRRIDVHHAVAGTLGTEDGQVAAVVLGQLGVNAGPAAAQGADEFADEALPLDRSHARDHGQPRMEAQAERVGSRLYD